MRTRKSLIIISIIFILTLQPSFAKNYNDSGGEKNHQLNKNPDSSYNSFEQSYFSRLKIDLKDINIKLKKTLPENVSIIEIINNSISKDH